MNTSEVLKSSFIPITSHPVHCFRLHDPRCVLDAFHCLCSMVYTKQLMVIREITAIRTNMRCCICLHVWNITGHTNTMGDVVGLSHNTEMRHNQVHKEAPLLPLAEQWVSSPWGPETIKDPGYLKSQASTNKCQFLSCRYQLSKFRETEPLSMRRWPAVFAVVRLTLSRSLVAGFTC